MKANGIVKYGRGLKRKIHAGYTSKEEASGAGTKTYPVRFFKV